MASNSLKNIDINNLHLLNLPIKLFIALMTIAAILGLGYIGLFENQIESLSEYEAKEVELKDTYKQKSINAASLNNLRDELAAIRSAFNIMLKQLPTDAEIPNLVQELHQAGSSNGLRLESLKIIQSPENGGGSDGKSSILNLSAIATTYKAKSVEELAAEAAQQQAAEAAQNTEQK